MNGSTHEPDVAHRSREERIAEGARSPFDDSVVSDDDIPWEEIMADMSAGARGYVFDPADLLKWAEEGEDEE